jgi:transcription antitermination factor NusG
MWYAIQVLTGHELELTSKLEKAKNIPDNVESILAPVKRIVQLKKNRLTETYETVYPGYIFLETRSNNGCGNTSIPANIWHWLKNTTGIIKIFMLPISKEEIELVLSNIKESFELPIQLNELPEKVRQYAQELIARKKQVIRMPLKLIGSIWEKINEKINFSLNPAAITEKTLPKLLDTMRLVI